MTPEQLAAKGLRVKELVWEEALKGDPDDILAFDYNIIHERDGWQVYRGAVVLGDPHHYLFKAKAAAQADYEARVLAALLEVG